jgi:hypothetical protein
MTNPIGSSIFAALAMTSVALAGSNDPKNTNGNGNEPKTPQDGAVKISAEAGKGITVQGDNFRLNLSNRLQVNLGYTNNEGATEDTFGVSMRRARTMLQGDAYKETVHYLVQLEWADDMRYRIAQDDPDNEAGSLGNLLDGILMWDFMKSDDMTMTMRFGQGKTLFGQEATDGAAGLEFIDRGLAARTYSAARSGQLQVVGKMGTGAFRWNAGMLNNDVAAGATGSQRDDSRNLSNEMNFVGGVSFGSGQDEMYQENRNQGALMAADETMWVANLKLAYGQNDDADGFGGAEYDAFTLNASGAAVMGRMHLLGEFFYRDESADTAASIESKSFGWQAQGTYTLEKGPSVQWAGGARLSGVHVTDVDAGANPILWAAALGEATIIEFQVVASAFYSGHNLKTQIGYTLQNVDPDVGNSATNHVFELQSQIIF